MEDTKNWLEGPVYSIQLYLITDGEYTKVGLSKYPNERLQTLSTASPRELSIFAAFQVCFPAHILETALHQKLTEMGYHSNREWFQIAPEEIVEKILPLVKDEVVRKAEQYTNARRTLVDRKTKWPKT